MPNKPMDTTLVDKAIVFAVNAHKNTERKGHQTPYVLHVLEAAAICETMTTDQEILAAAILHDTIEDTSVTYEDLAKEFGDRVARLVDYETQMPRQGVSYEDSWMDRKQIAIDRLATAPLDAKMVALSDKLSNIRAIRRDYEVLGERLWQKFSNKNPHDHKWYYEGLADSLKALSSTYAYKEYCLLVKEAFKNI